MWQEDKFCFPIIYLKYISNSFQIKVKDTQNGNEISTHAQKPTFIWKEYIGNDL